MAGKFWREAATLLLVSKSPNSSFDVLMMKRSSKSKFMPNGKYFTVSNCPVVWNKRYRVENSKK